MEKEFRWSDTRDADGYHLPGPDHLGRWAVIAMVISILLHVILFFALDRMKIAFGYEATEELATAPIVIRPPSDKPFEQQQAAPTEDTITPPDSSASLLEEVDLLELLPQDVEIDIAPSVIDPEYALKISNPLAAGDIEATNETLSTTFDLETNLPDFGRMESDLKPAAVGQITVDPGSAKVDDDEMSRFTEDLIKKGNGGLVDNGKLDGIESLDQLLDLPSNLLLSKKTMLPSDLIFEFGRAQLRESAKIGLMKLALLIDKNPGLYCWIEGHTDLIGSESSNIILSEQRAASVKRYLVESLRIDPKRIFTRGFGESQPLINGGDGEAQSPNRRVEIRMRKTPPSSGPIITPSVIETVPADPEPPKAVLVKPNLRAIPIEEVAPPRAEIVVPRAQPIEEPVLVAPRAIPIEP